LEEKSTMTKIIVHDEETGASSLLWDQVNCGKIVKSGVNVKGNEIRGNTKEQGKNLRKSLTLLY